MKMYALKCVDVALFYDWLGRGIKDFFKRRDSLKRGDKIPPSKVKRLLMQQDGWMEKTLLRNPFLLNVVPFWPPLKTWNFLKTFSEGSKGNIGKKRGKKSCF